jgi:8-oxo-dGTP diphosphatase
MPEQQEAAHPMVGISVIVKNGDRILLVRRQHVHGAGTWAPPGGHLNFGESFEDCAIRETREETAVEISDVKFRVLTNDVFTAEQKHYITIWMEAKYVSGEPRVQAPDEESEVGWFMWSNLAQPLFLPLQHLLSGDTLPSQTTEGKIGTSPEEPHSMKY